MIRMKHNLWPRLDDDEDAYVPPVIIVIGIQGYLYLVSPNILNGSSICRMNVLWLFKPKAWYEPKPTLYLFFTCYAIVGIYQASIVVILSNDYSPPHSIPC